MGVTPQLRTSAETVSCGNVTLSTAPTKTLTLTSSGKAPLLASPLPSRVLNSSFHPSYSLTLQLTFRPTVTGTASDSISLAMSGSGASPDSVLTLSCTRTSLINV